MKLQLRLSLALLFFCCVSVAGQEISENNTRVVQAYDFAAADYSPSDKFGAPYFEITLESDIPIRKDGPFVAFSLAWEYIHQSGRIHALEYFSEGKWQILPLNHHIQQTSDERKSELGFLFPAEKRFHLKIVTEGKPELKLDIHFYNPGHTKKSSSTAKTDLRSQTCPCSLPDYQDRSDWCPTNNCTPNPNPTNTNVELMVVHHSAGANSASDWAAVVRAIWDFHVNTNGWSDIGYNWLVDPQGTIYEGRGQGILGAHFCGMNSGTMGVCVIGNYTNVVPQDTTIQSLTKLLAWSSCEENIDPLGSGPIYENISGHRDGCATACPGDSFYPMMPDVRQSVADYIDEQCTPLVVDMLVDTIFTNVEEIVAGEEMLLRCRITNSSNIALQNIQVHYQINGSTLYTDVVQNLNSGSSINLFEAHTFQMAGDFEYCIQIEAIDEETNLDNNDFCGTLSVSANTATQELSAARLSVYPNPSKNVFYLQNSSAQQGKVQVFDALGKNILEVDLTGAAIQAIELDQASKGIYILRITIEGDAYYEKLLKQ